MPLMTGCPKVSGAGCGGMGGDAAKLTMASNAPRQQRVKATKARGLKRPDSEVEFFFMEIFPLLAAVEIVADNSKTPPRPDAFFRSLKNQPPNRLRLKPPPELDFYCYVSPKLTKALR